MTTHTQDPAVEWTDLLQELSGRRLEAAVSALRQSARSGWPASRDSVVSLVAYAQGRISADEYAAQTLVSLGLADPQTARALLHSVPSPRRTTPAQPAPARPVRASMDANAGSEFLMGRPFDDFLRDGSI
ncbi:MAG: hypothetical protein JWQ70_1196 [Aeromicrobium sp.]|jgi:hypothetical protein|nr:hypothetical protein [Aeromicrobium sp.]